MYKIKFSHLYPKLWGQETAELLRVKVVDRKGLHKDLIEYDTHYYTGHGIDGGYYALPNGLLIHLTFIGNKGIPFCTIRRYTQSKFEYYDELKGKQFEIIINK